MEELAALKESISVIIPFYNGSWCIERALKSIYKQTVPPKEIIVINDGSKEEERRFIEELQKQYDFILFHKENGGQGSARNQGAQLASGDFLCFLDQDDYYLPRHNELLLKEICKESDIDYVVGCPIMGDADGYIVPSVCIQPREFNNILGALAIDLMILPTATMYKRFSFFEIGGFDEQFTGYEDDDLFLRAFRCGQKRGVLNEAVYVWCDNESNTSHSVKMCRSRLRFVKKWLGLFQNTKNVSILRSCFFPRFYRVVLKDTFESIVYQTNSREELKQIFKCYVDMIADDPTIGRRFKKMVTIVSRLLLGNEKRCIRLYRLSHSSIGNLSFRILRKIALVFRKH